MTAFNRNAGHSVNDAAVFRLRDSQPASLFHDSHAVRAILTHTRHQDTNGAISELRCNGFEQHIGRWTMSIHLLALGKNNHVAQRHMSYFHVLVPR